MIQYIFIGTWVDVESVKAFVIAIFYSTQKRSDKRAIDIVQVSRIRFRVYARAGGGGYDVEVEMCYKVWVWISNLLALKLNTNKKGLASWYHSVIDLRPNAFYRILVSYGRRNDASFIVQSFSYHHRERKPNQTSFCKISENIWTNSVRSYQLWSFCPTSHLCSYFCSIWSPFHKYTKSFRILNILR